jgi:hypothetical protein
MTTFSQTIYNGFRIQDDHTHYSWFEHLLSVLDKMFQEASHLHRTRTLIGRFDFTFPVEYCDSVEDSKPINGTRSKAVFSSFLADFVESIDLNLKLIYYWVREQTDSSIHPHYHLLLFISKDIKRSLHRLYILANVLWCKHLNIPTTKGFVQEIRTHTVKWKDGYIPQNESLAKAFRHAAYICKCNEKFMTPKYASLYGCSRLFSTSEA